MDGLTSRQRSPLMPVVLGEVAEFERDGAEPAPDPRAALRECLAAMRLGLIEARKRDGCGSRLGAVLAHIAAALDTLDEAQDTRRRAFWPPAA